MGSRTSFEVGGTLTGFANSEHVPIGIIATNINNRTYGRNVMYKTVTASKPMVPTGWDDLKVDDIINKFYLSTPAMCMGVPRSAYSY